MPSAKDIIFGTKGKLKQATTKTPEQLELLKLINEGLTNGTGAFGDIFGKFNPEEFEKGVTQPALKNFQENILPQIQEKYIAGNAAGGSGQAREKRKAGVDLQSKLSELLYGAQQGQKQNQIAGAQTALGQNTFENIYKPGTEGALKGFVQGVGQGIGTAAGGFIAG